MVSLSTAVRPPAKIQNDWKIPQQKTWKYLKDEDYRDHSNEQLPLMAGDFSMPPCSKKLTWTSTLSWTNWKKPARRKILISCLPPIMVALPQMSSHRQQSQPHEGGLRVQPSPVRWKKYILWCTGYWWDLLPTFHDLSGSKAPSQGVDGGSLPMFSQKLTKVRWIINPRSNLQLPYYAAAPVNAIKSGWL